MKKFLSSNLLIVIEKSSLEVMTFLLEWTIKKAWNGKKLIKYSAFSNDHYNYSVTQLPTSYEEMDNEILLAIYRKKNFLGHWTFRWKLATSHFMV